MDRSYAAEVARECKYCSENLPAEFFAGGATKCRTCSSEYDRRRRAAAPLQATWSQKECRHCKQLLPASQYGAARTNPSGLNAWCNVCLVECARKSRARNAAAPLPLEALAPTKYCTNCKSNQPRAAFHKSQFRWDGLESHCKACHKKRMHRQHAARRQQQPPVSAAPLQQRQLSDSSG